MRRSGNLGGARSVGLVVGGAVLVGLLGWSAWETLVDHGPLSLGGTGDIVCTNADVGEPVGIGQPVTVAGDDAVVVDRVSVRDATGLEVVGHYIVPVVDTRIGSFRAGESEPPGWPSRVEAAGAVIEPGTVADLVLILERDGAGDGSLQTVSVRYTAGSKGTYEAVGTMRYEVESDC
ncbi:hypothetical protein ACFQHV_00645 [Promicromonospora thailandica]|uniref:Uncharacterized protein n=1 Tax=Promicromonospora thailandica TaxID=765201 RepID=A0A9X2FZU0_9MICO|nr:hypothetical protein [Promicromonospora thailandica]MCP2262753.1 hypothetical protein [Promicromonospora thailandica]